ncbi:MAG: hypothetical protein RBQ75_00965 [Bacteroidales bacterium]|nr:hypothetical protein [Bacteroidales bacterium]
MKKNIFVLLIALILLAGCDKEPKEHSFTGMVKDQFLDKPVANVKLNLQAQVLQDNIFSVAYQTISTGYTDDLGRFQLNYEDNVYDEYRLILNKDGYFYKTINLGNKLINDKIYTIAAKGVIKIHIKNINPYDENDFISISWIIPNDAYFNSEINFPFIVNGLDVDLFLVCNVNAYAPYILVANWKHNAIEIIRSDTITPLFNDTTYYDLFY